MSESSETQNIFVTVYKSYIVRITLVLGIVIIAFAVAAAREDDTTQFITVGAVIGVVSAGFVMCDISINRRGSGGAMKLLFWRAFSDVGVAIRFLLTRPFNRYLCHSSVCDVSANANNCGFASAFLEFFEIASEMWFLIVAIDLWRSLVNPFSSTNSSMFYYHIIVWFTSLFFALPTGLNSKIYGFWFVDASVDNTAICWITNYKHNPTVYVYVLFYIPLIVVYVIAAISVFVAYRRLRHGISSTIIHRMKALVINSINVLVYIAYWGALLLLLTFAFLLDTSSGEKWSLRLLFFMISAKGLSAVIVWILTIDVHFEPNDGGLQVKEEGGVDLNGALRQELLYFATTGIRTCASNGAMLKKDQSTLVLYLQHKEERNEVELSPLFFLRLIFGREQEKQKIVALANAAHEITRLTPLEMELRDNSIVSAAPSTVGPPTLNPTHSVDSTFENQRMSQRPTEVSGKSSFSNNNSFTAGLLTAVEALEMGTKTKGSSVVASSTAPVRQKRSSNVPGEGRNTEIVVTRIENTVSESYGWAAFVDLLDRTFGDGRRDVEFVEEEPYHFQRVRRAQRVSDDDYIGQFRTTIKERVTQGGASGAFFFFSKDEMFIAKSCTPEEFDVLTSNAKAYADYLESAKGKNSYISKVYGAYTMRIYGISLHFFVMNNLFHDKDALGNSLSIHEKYDIKGSTVNRSSVPPQEGQTATCTHCEQKFVYHRKKKAKTMSSRSTRTQSLNDDHEKAAARFKCTVTVNGEHEPNVIMKDNDLKYKIQLPKPIAKKLMIQLENDAHFLYSVGVMDYSLLVGVHNTQYDVRNIESNYSSVESSLNSLASNNSQLLAAAGCANNSVEMTTMESVSKRLEVSRVVGPDTYIMGIIDFQQQWNLNKKMERFVKVQIKGEDSYGLSAIAPDIYRDRFISHIRGILDVDE